MKAARIAARAAISAGLLVVCQAFALAEKPSAPMATLDPQFDQKHAADIVRLRKQIANLTRAEATASRAKKRDKAALIERRQKLDETRNVLTDLATDYVAQIELAEALVRIELGQALADRYRKDFADTLWRLGKRAEAGNARAQATLGTLYRLGIVAERSEDKACAYYGRAAQAGYVTALYYAAACGDPKSEASQRMLALAAEGDHPVAQEMLGRQCLREKRDAACALDWLGRAAAQGRASATSLLGWMYSTGELVARDDRRAFGYFMDAATLGDAAAQNNVGQMYETGRGVAVSGGEAFAWYKRAAETGLGSAQVNLARSFIEGRGTPADRAAASFWLQQARKQGVAEAAKLQEWLAAH